MLSISDIFCGWISKLQALNGIDVEYFVFTSESREHSELNMQ